MEENTNKGLTKKTKSELIEIILRKDDIERECRSKINNLKEDLADYKERYEQAINHLNDGKYIIDKQKEIIIKKENIISDMQSEFDTAATEVAEVKEEIAKYKLYVKSLTGACIVLIFILIFKLLVF